MQKKQISVFFYFFFSFTLFAFPGITDYIPTVSGEYVYYRNYNFDTETYIGFLQYDEGTYSIRYYSPKATSGLPSIQLLISMNPTADFPDLIGERILSSVTAEDTDTMNYMHDLLYELASRRKKMNGSDFSSTVKSTEEYTQFGGEVTLQFENYIPIFNLNTITDMTGKVLFQALCSGKLQDSNDNSFDIFSGIPEMTNTIIPATASDDKWVQVADNFWLLDNEALAFVNIVHVAPEELSTISYNFSEYLERNMVYPSNNSYFLLQTREKSEKKGYTTITSNIWDTVSGNFIYDIKLLKNINTETYTIISFSIYQDFYSSNKKYFQALIKHILE